MNGVEILSSAQVASEFAFNKPVFWIVFGIVFVICILFSIFEVVIDDCEWTIIPFLLIVGLVGGAVIGALFGRLAEYPVAYETHYKVTAEDSVSMNEFFDKYELLDQEGKIYIVKERE